MQNRNPVFCGMKLITWPILAALLVCFSSVLYGQHKFNGNFEILDRTGNPLGWDFTLKNQTNYLVKLDSTVKRQGKYSVSITNRPGPDYGSIVFRINKRYRGSRLVLGGNLKTKDVTDGFAGLWMRTDGANGKRISFDNTEKPAFNGTNDWKEFMIQLPYDGREVATIHVGAVMAGKGTMWVDSLRLYIDEKPIDDVLEIQLPLYEALNDTQFDKSSGIDTILFTPSGQKYLTVLGELWGFLKYHHPAIANGKFNWDAELFRILPDLIRCTNDMQASMLMERWVDKLGQVKPCTNCKTPTAPGLIALKPDYGSLFKNKIFSNTLSNKLAYILKNSNNLTHYYVDGLKDAAHTSFPHESSYADKKYPDAGQRLLALYRYWNTIQYFSPYRDLTTENWNSVLPAFIPQVIKAHDEYEYVNTITRLIASIHDSHAFIESEVRERSFGKYKLPFDAAFVENQFVVVSSLKKTADDRKNLRLGDIITAINGEKVQSLVNKYTPLTPASNRGTVLRDMRGLYLLRGNDSLFTLQIIRDHLPLAIVQSGSQARSSDLYLIPPKPVYHLIDDDIGYIHCETYQNTQLDSIKTRFKNTKGIIVDMRGYPIDVIESTLAAYFKSGPSDFVKFSERSISQPGTFIFKPAVKNGTISTNYYKGKVVVLVNENTQSNSEFVTMAMQSAPNVTVIGSTSAGADGNITPIYLPGGITTWISGIGVYYPDGYNAQRVGVKIDRIVKPTVKGIKERRDEVLEEAKKLIRIDNH
ncbi:S41 family peptidase [Pedobacter metabolipauper]|uniref:Peptidase S41-like protein n=1 Tax=Pedobacter metabolipauper TaxID=425513 RepID=A0A4R6SSA0_9SPHI|nr:S41 family peptidase [Pedobacter metabolipauper]TDQ06623.1 peptidase S41-like protein [Pedobacter metabolipauper]